MGKSEKKEKKSRKGNRNANASAEVMDYYIATPNRAEIISKGRKEDNRNKKHSNKVDGSSNYDLDPTCKENVTILAVDSEYPKEEVKKKKRKIEPDQYHDNSNGMVLGGVEETNKDWEKDEVYKEEKSSQKDNIDEMKTTEQKTWTKKKKKGKRVEEVGDFDGKTKALEVGQVKENFDVDVSEKKVETKKRKREKKKGKDDLVSGDREVVVNKLGSESPMVEDKEFQDGKDNACLTGNKMQARKEKNANTDNCEKPVSVEGASEDPKPKGKPKKVSFSGHVDIFPSSDDPSIWKEHNQEEELVQGKRFSRKEDEIVKEAVFDYINAHALGSEGLNMVLHCKSYPKLKNCWKEIGAALPHRPYTAVYYRAHILFERDEKRSWTAEELEMVKKFHETQGSDWKKLADELGKHRVHLKDAWRRIKLPNAKKGHWSQEEYQSLFDLVNKDLRMKAFDEKKSKHGMLRDNISWSAISDRLSTRTGPLCCMKWYKQLTSPMVAEGNWADADDYRLLDALYRLDACCIEDVDWDNLLRHRSGYICRRRWNQMVNHIGEHGNKSFAEQVEILSKRYSPDVLEAREAWDSKPVVP